jgi:23S rRNA pseudouridine2605 synthase/16S rRNA pseudouridine516 synthase
MKRLQKVMAEAGVASRRKCEELIRDGKVKVNGKVVTEMGFKVEPSTALIEVEGKTLLPEKKIYLLLNKPKGYVTTLNDPQKRPTVLDLIPQSIEQRIYPVGRLDYHTEGLLLLTNDGELTFALTHPKKEIEKTYLAWVKKSPSEKELEQLRKGIELEDGPTSPAKVKVIKEKDGLTLLQITIHEGRKRQIRRMLKAIGYPVVNLKRIKIGPLSLGNLKKGECRHLTEEEVKKLYRACGLEYEKEN